MGCIVDVIFFEDQKKSIGMINSFRYLSITSCGNGISAVNVVNITKEYPGKDCSNAYTRLGDCYGWDNISKETCIQVNQTI